MRPAARASAVLVAAVVAAPVMLGAEYLLRVLILAGIFVVLAISYDLIVGQVGSLSLAHPAFYGVGAYTTGILTTRYGLDPLPTFLVAAALGAVTAVVVGIPSFRLRDRSFAIGTLGMAWVLQLVANNWIGLTRGPMCITGVPPLMIMLPGGVELTTIFPRTGYVLIVVIAIATYLIAWAINSSRVGRAFHAIRENELLAEMQGVNSLFYKMLALGIGAAIAAVAGGYYATYSSVVCPSEMAMMYTITLLIIVYLGGAGSLRGVTVAAVVFVVLPEVLRVAAAARLFVYGGLLLGAAIYLPGGVEALINRVERAWPGRSATPRSGR